MHISTYQIQHFFLRGRILLGRWKHGSKQLWEGLFIHKVRMRQLYGSFFQVTGGGKLAYTRVGGAGSVSSTSVINDGNWHHVAAVNDGTLTDNITLYVDGVAEATKTLTDDIDVFPSRIGFYNTRFIGEMDEVRFWSDARTSNEINSNMRNELCGNEANLTAYYDLNQGTAGGNNTSISTIFDKTSNNHDASFTLFSKTGNASNFIASTAIQSNALDFTGTLDAVDFTSIALIPASSSPWTVEGWIKCSASGNFFSQSTGAVANRLRIWITSAGKLAYTTGSGSVVGTTTNIHDGSWHHVAIVNDGSGSDNITLYLDGSADGTGTETTTIGPAPAFLGVYNGASFIGQMDEFRFWSVARSQLEIQNNKDKVLSGSFTDLTAYYRFNQGNASGANSQETILKDLSENCNDGTLYHFVLSGGYK